MTGVALDKHVSLRPPLIEVPLVMAASHRPGASSLKQANIPGQVVAGAKRVSFAIPPNNMAAPAFERDVETTAEEVVDVMVQEEPGRHIISCNKRRLSWSAPTSAEGGKKLRLDSVGPDVETVRTDAERRETSIVLKLKHSAAGTEQQALNTAGDEDAHDGSRHMPVPNCGFHERAEPVGAVRNARTRRSSETRTVDSVCLTPTTDTGHSGHRGRRESKGDSIEATMTAIHSGIFARPLLQEIYNIHTMWDGWVQNFGLKSFLSLPWQKSASDGECAEFIHNYAHSEMCTTVRGARIDLSKQGLAAAFTLEHGSVKLTKKKQYNSDNFPKSARTRDGYKTKHASDQWADRYAVMLSLFFLKPVHRDVSRGLVSWMAARDNDKDLATVFHSCFRQEMHRLRKSKAANCETVTTHIGPHVHILIHGTDGDSLEVDKAVMDDEDVPQILQDFDNARAKVLVLLEQRKHMKANEKQLEVQLLAQQNSVALEEQLRVMTGQLQEKDAAFNEQAEDLRRKDATINGQAQHLRRKDATINEQAEDLRRMTTKLERQKTTFSLQMIAKDAHIVALSSLISDLDTERKDLTRSLQNAWLKNCSAVPP